MKTYAPSSTNRLAVANPRPVEPPVTNAVLPLRSAMTCLSLVLDCPVKNFRCRAAFFTADEDGHAWTFLGGHLLNGLIAGICGGVFEARTMRPFPALGSTDRAALTQCCASDEHYSLMNSPVGGIDVGEPPAR